MLNIKKTIAIPAFGALALIGGAVASYAGLASAQTPTTTTASPSATRPVMPPHVDGKITAIDGNILTITEDAHGQDVGGTYTVDIGSATITKSGGAGSVSSFAVGDMIFAEGTITGTNVVATKISDGFEGRGFGHGGPGRMGHGVTGTVTAVSGSTITVTGKDGKSYTVNASAAQVSKMVTESLSDIVVGDTIGVQGEVSGTSITANHIMDDMVIPTSVTQ